MGSTATRDEVWPSLPLEAWAPTYATLHLWTQMVGKVRLANSPWVNHGWHVTLYVTPRGLTTSSIPDGDRAFEIELDFVDQRLSIRTSDGAAGGFALAPRSVAAFHRELVGELKRLDLPAAFHGRPNEVADAIPFARDETHADYDGDQARRFWRALVQIDRVLKRFRAGFVGKCSPVHFFWGGPDLAVTRFSGRRAPPHPGGIPNLPDWITREAYSHEVASCGFWPGGGPVPHAAFYAYAYPEPAAYARAPVAPEGAYYHDALREFILPYDVVRRAESPDETLLAFLQSTYAAAADLADWDRAALERDGDVRAAFE